MMYGHRYTDEEKTFMQLCLEILSIQEGES